MRPTVAPPDASSTRARIADWLEVAAIESYPRPFSAADFIGSLDLANDPDLEETPSDMDRDIVGGSFELVMDQATTEVRWRAAILGDYYPFELSLRGHTWAITFAPRSRASKRSSVGVRRAHATYVTSLLVSATRNELVAKSGEDQAEWVFQAIAYLVAPAFVGGYAFWMGFPRPTGAGFGEALETLVSQIGVGERGPHRLTDQVHAKDGGVDLVGWTTFGDDRRNIMIWYGQVATGSNWRDKSVESRLDSHFLSWLSRRPSKHYLPVMYIPHVLHDAVPQSAAANFEQYRADLEVTLEAELGVVIDRIRLTGLAAQGVSGRLASGLSASEDPMMIVLRLARWVQRAIDSISGAS